MTDRRLHLIVVREPRTAADVLAAKDVLAAALDAVDAAALAYVETAVSAGENRQGAIAHAVAVTATRAGKMAADMGSREGWQRWGELCAGFFKLWELDEPDPRADPAWWIDRTDHHGFGPDGAA